MVGIKFGGCPESLNNLNICIMKHLNFERVESFDINHTFFFTTEKSNMRIDYTSLTNIINAYNGEITIYPTYSLDGEDVRMEGIKGDSPALYVAIMDSVIKYCEAAGKDKNTEKEIINILCGILHLSNDRDEAIATLSEYVDMYDSESDVPNLEDSQVALMEYLPVFYNTTESAYTYYCELIRLTPEVKLADIQDAFHNLQGAMDFLKNMAKETVKDSVVLLASAEDKVQVARAVSTSLKYSMDGIRDFAKASRDAIESLIVTLDTYAANADEELWQHMWKKPLRELKDNLFMHDTHIQEVMRQAMKPKIKKELISFEEWTVSVSRYIHRIEREAFLYFNDAVKIDGSVLADMYIDSACEDSAIVSEVVTSENISHFISNALDDLEEDLDDRLLSSASIVLSIDKKKYKFDVTHVLYGIYEDEMLASGYTEEEIEEVNEVEF